jgi:hypothetical protein
VKIVNRATKDVHFECNICRSVIVEGEVCLNYNIKGTYGHGPNLIPVCLHDKTYGALNKDDLSHMCASCLVVLQWRSV